MLASSAAASKSSDPRDAVAAMLRVAIASISGGERQSYGSRPSSLKRARTAPMPLG